MTGPDVQFIVNGVPYDDCVLQMDMWQEASAIGNWEVIADAAGGCVWPAINTITTNMTVTLMVDDPAGVGQIMMRGYVDDVMPFAGPGVNAKYYKITGRNRALDLAQHFVTQEYVNMAADVIIDAAVPPPTSLLDIIPSGLTRVTVGPAPGNIDYEADRTYLVDAVRDICRLTNRDYYVMNDAFGVNATLNYTNPGAAASGVALVEGTNIIKMESFGEEVGFNVKNHVEAYAGGLNDHWTDLNATDWTAFGANVVTDDLALYVCGKGAIRVTQPNVVAAMIGVDLTFPRYDYDVTWGRLDMSETSQGSYSYLISDSVLPIRRVRMRLTDNGGRTIEFYRSVFLGLVRCGDCTDQPRINEWCTVSFPVGSETAIAPALIANTPRGTWYEFNWVSPPIFNWSDIRSIGFYTSGDTVPQDEYIVIDCLRVPNVEVRSIQTSVATYGTRMTHIARQDIRNQVELDAFAVAELARLNLPKESIHVIATGQTGTPFPVETVDVTAPSYGLPGATVYRIFKVHHQVVKNSESSNYPGYTYITEYDLIRQAYHAGGTQYVDDIRFKSTGRPSAARWDRNFEGDRYRYPWDRPVP